MHARVDEAAQQRHLRTAAADNDPVSAGRPTAPPAAPPAPSRRPWPIWRARPVDAYAISVLVADALHPLPLSAWLVPEPVRRHQVLIDVAGIHVQHALTEGRGWVTPDFAAAALWLPSDADRPVRPADYQQRLTAAYGAATDRFRLLDQLLDNQHTVQRHHQHLSILAVRRDRQQQGLATRLLAHQRTILDAAGVPACATATDAISRELYVRHGYADFGPPIDVPDSAGGIRLWPMWRIPAPSTDDQASARPSHTDGMQP